jgi:hypothetical protein
MSLTEEERRRLGELADNLAREDPRLGRALSGDRRTANLRWCLVMGASDKCDGPVPRRVGTPWCAVSSPNLPKSHVRLASDTRVLDEYPLGLNCLDRPSGVFGE